MGESMQIVFEAAERLLEIKWGADLAAKGASIVPGSMTQELNHPVFANKRRVKIKCKCGAQVERATSDVFSFIGCPGCAAGVRKANALLKKVALAEALAQYNLNKS